MVLVMGAAARVCEGEDSGQRSDLARCTFPMLQMLHTTGRRRRPLKAPEAPKRSSRRCNECVEWISEASGDCNASGGVLEVVERTAEILEAEADEAAATRALDLRAWRNIFVKVVYSKARFEQRRFQWKMY